MLIEPITSLLLARYRLAIARRPDLLRAEPWYWREGERIRAAARAAGVDELRAIDAAAALSPAGRWDSIVSRLLAFYRAVQEGAPPPKMPTYGRNVRAAVAILRGRGAPSGPKVSRFARNLRGDPGCVTVDRWAARAAGLPESGGARWYRSIEEAYRSAASVAGIPPSTFQAILWVALRDGILPYGLGKAPRMRQERRSSLPLTRNPMGASLAPGAS